MGDLDRSALYLELLPRTNAAEVKLPDDPALLREHEHWDEWNGE